MAEEIVIRPPGPDAPGFLRRMRRSMELQKRLATGDPAALDAMIDFVVENAAEIRVPVGVEPRDAILDLSQEQFEVVFGAMRGDAGGVDPQNGD